MCSTEEPTQAALRVLKIKERTSFDLNRSQPLNTEDNTEIFVVVRLPFNCPGQDVLHIHLWYLFWMEIMELFLSIMAVPLLLYSLLAFMLQHFFPAALGTMHH